MLKSNNDICISNCGKTVGYRNCCPAHAYLDICQLLGCHSTKIDVLLTLMVSVAHLIQCLLHNCLTLIV